MLGSMLGYWMVYSAAEKLHLPLHAAYLQPVHPTGLYPNAMFKPLPPSVKNRDRYNRFSYPAFQRVFWYLAASMYNDARKSVMGLPPLKYGDLFGELTNPHGPQVLYGYSSHILPEDPDWPDRIRVTGFWYLDPPPTWQPPERLLRYVDSRRRQWLLLAALNLGFALASKHLALFALALFCPGLLLALWRHGAGWRQAVLAAVVLGCLSLLLALPWYLRSYLATGNPVFETMYGVFGAPPARWPPATDLTLRRFLDSFGRPRTLANLLTLPWHMTIHAASYGGTLGPIFLMLLPMLALRRLRGALPWLIAFVALWMLLWFSPLASFEVRHLMPIAPTLAILAASAFGRASALARQVGGGVAATLVAGGLALLLVLNLPPFTPLHEVDRVNWDGWLSSVLYGLPWGVATGGESVDGYLAGAIRSYAVWQFADANLPPTARVLTWSGGEQFYTQRDRLWAHAALAEAITAAKPGDEQQALEGLRALGITHIITGRQPPEEPNPWAAYALTGPVARANWYEELYSDYWYVLYRIRWEILEPAR